MITLLFVVFGLVAVLAVVCDVEVLPEKDFQRKVLDGVGVVDKKVQLVETAQQKLLSDYSRLDGETKKSFDELTKVKNACNDLAAVTAALQKVQLNLQREQRMAFGDPIQRIISNDEHRANVNALVRHVCRASVSDEMKQRLLSMGATPGSTLITTDLAQEIYDVLLKYGAWGTLGVRRVSTKTTACPIKTARALASFITTEGSTQISDDSTKAGSSVSLAVRAIACLINVSRELLEDSEFDVSADVLNDFVEAFNYRLDWAAFSADGTADATDGSMTGLFEYATAANAAGGNTTISALELDDFVRCLTTVSAGVLQRPARWWIHPTLLAKVCLVRDGNLRPIFQTAQEAPIGNIGSILGYPVTPVGAAPSDDAASKKIAVFGDPQAMAVGIRSDFQAESSDDFRFDYLNRTFRLYGRAGVIGRIATGVAVLTTAAA